MRDVSHTYAQNVIHVVFSTKERRKAILPEWQPRMWAYVTGICGKTGVQVHAVGGMADHIHLLLQIPPGLAVAKAVNAIKVNSSRWANEKGFKFSWQEGYGAFSVSRSLEAAAVRYIENQKAHHKKMGFDAEFVALLKKHGMEFDAKYVFG